MNDFKEISLSELNKYKDPFSLFSDWAALTMEGKEEADSLIIGWGGLGILWRKPCCTVYVHEKRYSKHLMDECEYFTVSVFDRAKYQKELEYLGSVSGKDEDKIKGSKLTFVKGDAPYFDEAELVIVCKKMGKSKFDLKDIIYPKEIKEWYEKDDTHSIYFGEIVKILKKNAEFKVNAKTQEFLKKSVYPISEFESVTEENAEDIVDFIIVRYVTPLVNKQEKGEKIDDELLKEADAAIDDITDNELW